MASTIAGQPSGGEAGPYMTMKKENTASGIVSPYGKGSQANFASSNGFREAIQKGVVSGVGLLTF